MTKVSMQVRSRSLLLAALTATVTLISTGCDSAQDTGRTCETQADCLSTEVCTDGRCVAQQDSDAGLDAAPATDAMLCADGRASCGSTCCEADQVCNAGSCEADCGLQPICGGLCCGPGRECLEDRCVEECEDEANRCGDDCCGGEEACLSGACVGLGEPCALTEECEVDEICLLSLERCAPRSAVEVCEFRPPVGVFSPVTACRWQPPAEFARFGEVVMTPSVMNMTDDNGDGETDTLDIPDIVFVAFDRATDNCCTTNGRLVIASGACNEDGTMDTHAVVASPPIDNSTGVALGNLHPDSMTDERAPEIVATFRTDPTAGATIRRGTIAFTRTADDGSAWTELWRSPYPTTGQMEAGGTPSLADLDADGAPEVIIGNVVLDGLTGELVWDGDVTVGTNAGVGNNAFLGPSSTVADLDLDGNLEVIAGNTVYEGRTGAEVWTFDYGTTSGSSCGGNIPCDGFNAVANFDDDPEGEVVIVRRGEVFVIHHDGVLLHRVLIPKDDCSANESGPPTVADFDGDGRPEIGTAGADFYVVVDFDCVGDPLPEGCASENILWTVPNQDCSSRATASSVFDFEGDGAAEVVYADETTFRIFDGRTGTVLFEDATHSSNTRIEMPVIVDVDNDGQSEVVIPEPNTNAEFGGIEIWEDTANNWVRTRRVWNQHAYHVTNITEDGQVPRVAERNWQNGRLNNFRQNVQPGGLFDAPDLQILEITLADCVPDEALRIAVRVTNDGALGVAPGIAVWARLTKQPSGEMVDLGVQRTTTRLLPGQSEDVIFEFVPTGDEGFDFLDFSVDARVDDDGTGAGAYNECDEENNGGMSATLMTCSFG